MINECNPKEKRTILGYFTDQFGIPRSVFGPYTLYKRRTSVFLGPKISIDSPAPYSIGILLAVLKEPIIPSHSAVSLFGNYATKNVLRLEKSELIRFIKGEVIMIDDSAIRTADAGSIIVRYAHFSVGGGFYKKGTLKLAFPFAMHEKLKYL